MLTKKDIETLFEIRKVVITGIEVEKSLFDRICDTLDEFMRQNTELQRQLDAERIGHEAAEQHWKDIEQERAKGFNSRIKQIEQEHDQARRALVVAAEALTAVEYGDLTDDGEHCPDCGYYINPKHMHAHDCKLSAAIIQVTEALK